MNKDEFISNYKAFGNEMIIDLVDTFQKDFPNKLNDLQKATSEKDFDAIKKLSHSLKGSVGIFYAEEAHQAALILEKAGNEEDDRNLDEKFQNLRNALSQLDNELSEMKTELS